jgi:hypothetical protein
LQWKSVGLTKITKNTNANAMQFGTFVIVFL